MKSKFLEKISQYKFALMILSVVALTVIMTVASIWIYTSSGAINIDLSRPGFENIREETSASDPETQFKSSGPIDKDSVDDFNTRLESLQVKINSMNNFSNDVMSDESLGITEKR